MVVSPTKPGYGDGIRTYILYNNRIEDLKNIKNEDSDAENEDLEFIKNEEKKEDLLNETSAHEEASFKTKTNHLFNILMFSVTSIAVLFISLANVDYASKVSNLNVRFFFKMQKIIIYPIP